MAAIIDGVLPAAEFTIKRGESVTFTALAHDSDDQQTTLEILASVPGQDPPTIREVKLAVVTPVALAIRFKGGAGPGSVTQDPAKPNVFTYTAPAPIA